MFVYIYIYIYICICNMSVRFATTDKESAALLMPQLGTTRRPIWNTGHIMPAYRDVAGGHPRGIGEQYNYPI